MIQRGHKEALSHWTSSHSSVMAKSHSGKSRSSKKKKKIVMSFLSDLKSVTDFRDTTADSRQQHTRFGDGSSPSKKNLLSRSRPHYNVNPIFLGVATIWDIIRGGANLPPPLKIPKNYQIVMKLCIFLGNINKFPNSIQYPHYDVIMTSFWPLITADVIKIG